MIKKKTVVNTEGDFPTIIRDPIYSWNSPEANRCVIRSQKIIFRQSNKVQARAMCLKTITAYPDRRWFYQIWRKDIPLKHGRQFSKQRTYSFLPADCIINCVLCQFTCISLRNTFFYCRKVAFILVQLISHAFTTYVQNFTFWGKNNLRWPYRKQFIFRGKLFWL